MEKHQHSNKDNMDVDFLTDDEDEENLNPKKVREENRSLKRKLRKIEHTKESLEDEVKRLTNKVNIFAEKLSSVEENHAREMRVLQEATDFKLEEKLHLYNQLKMYVDKQEQLIHDMQESKGEEVLFNVSNSVSAFVDQISNLQDKLIKFQEENCQLKGKVEEANVCVEKLKDKIDKEYVSKVDFDLLVKEKEILSKANRKPLECLTPNMRSTISKLNLNTPDTPDLRKKQTELEKENRGLRKKVRELESRCTTLTYAPPKVQVREIVDESVEKKLMEVEDQKFQLELKIKELNFEHDLEVKSLKETIQGLEKKVTQLNKEGEMNVQECRDIVSNIRDLRSRLENEKKKNKELMEQISTKDRLYELNMQKQQDNEKILRENLQTQHQSQTGELERKTENLYRLVEEFRNLPNVLAEIRSQKNEIDENLRFFIGNVATAMNTFKSNILQAVSETNYRSSLLAFRYKKEVELRKKLHNELVELKGNIRVFCRVRPVIREDGPDCEQAVTFVDDEDDTLYVRNKGSMKTFQMDRVFKPNASQKKVFEDVESLVTSCLDGYNVCIFAYGQTGAGKTFTMEGTKADPGLNQLALQHLFKCSAEMKDWKFTILVSFVEIYNEMLRDLLSVDPKTKLDIKQNKDGTHYVPGLTHVEVKSVADVNEVFSLGHVNRSTACTDMNERSSRSHSVLTVMVIGKNSNTDIEICGKLNLVDLAGSERVSKSGSDGQRMREAQNINKSLSALGDVIHALKNKSSHVPYRNTKLTYLLQESLGGDSKTLMVVQVSPVDKNASETICSLNFAQRVRQVELGMASRKEQKSDSKRK